MLIFTDRLYGDLELPETARRLAGSCPLLLRLREVRLPNVPFLTYPSFANVSRYEHALGTCHLAWWWAKRNRLPTDDAEAFALAALYHDSATPAFSHLFEEVLHRIGFDHEEELARVLGARSALPGKEHIQVFLGREPKLRSVLGSRAQPHARLSLPGIFRLATGEDALGRALRGDLDIDNIDNVIRAATAMGVGRGHEPHPLEVASALVWQGDEVRLSTATTRPVALWKGLRRALYQAILQSPQEFLGQTQLKWALEIYAEEHPDFLADGTWRFTEPEILFQHLRTFPPARELVDGLRLGRLPRLLASGWVPDASRLIDKDGWKVIQDIRDHCREIFGVEVFVNFYVDKRERQVSLPPAELDSLFADKGRGGGAVSGSHPPKAVIGVVTQAGWAPSATQPLRRAQLQEAAFVLQTLLGTEMEVTGDWVPARSRSPFTQVPL